MRVIYRIIKAARPNFNEPLFIILKKNTSGQVVDKGEKVTIYWYTNGEIIDSNFAKSNEGEIILTLNESINLYIVAKKGNETMRKDLYLSVIEPNTPITTTSRPTISERNPKIFTMLLVSLGILSFVVFLVLKKKLV